MGSIDYRGVEGTVGGMESSGGREFGVVDGKGRDRMEGGMGDGDSG